MKSNATYALVELREQLEMQQTIRMEQQKDFLVTLHETIRKVSEANGSSPYSQYIPISALGEQIDHYKSIVRAQTEIRDALKALEALEETVGKLEITNYAIKDK